MRLEFGSTVTLMPLGNRSFDDAYSGTSSDLQTILNNGIDAAENGDRETARALLMEASEIDPLSEDAWMWLASISDHPEELVAFLSNVLTINPSNQRAAEWMASTKALLAKTLPDREIAVEQVPQIAR